jgi:hypothetical protein
VKKLGKRARRIPGVGGGKQKESTPLHGPDEERIVSFSPTVRDGCSVSGLMMPRARKRLRLIACVGLVAFLAANTHAGLALAGSLDGLPCPGCEAGGVAHDHRKARVDPQEQGDHDRCPCDPDCPDCPKEPHGPQSPCPGGCAFCSVAKVPCLAADSGLTQPSLCLGSSSPEQTALSLSEFSSRLLRPPRG